MAYDDCTKVYLLDDEKTELVCGQHVELLTSVAGDVLRLLVIHHHPGEHGADVLQPLVKGFVQFRDIDPG